MTNQRPLDGITVVSLEHAIAAPFCTRQLADLGARVIKIERPGAGDFARGYDERVRGLRAGGDDYLTKPFASDEMAARVEVLLRRKSTVKEFETALRVADLELNLISREASRAEQPLSLLPTEYKLLEFLMRNTGQILSRMMIFEEVWGYHFDPGTNLIDVHIGRLRKKIDPPGLTPLIRTVRGSGYVIAEPL